METLLRHHIDSTEKRFDKLDERLKDLHKEVLDLRYFKTESKATAKSVSLLVSGLTGLLTLIVSALINAFLGKHN